MENSGSDEAERMGKPPMSLARKHRVALWSVFALFALAVLLPLGSYSLHGLGPDGLGLHGFGGVAHAEETSATAGNADAAANPRSNYWRAVTDGVSGYSSVSGPGANILIERGGNNWQALRNGPIATILPWLIVGMAVVLLLFHLVFGKQKLEQEPSGARIKRWGGFDRLVHWVTAISFIALAVTGLSMLIGRAVLIPILGKAGFALWAQASITIHNVVGPVFSLGVALMIILWIWHNFPAKGDLTWLKQGGGMFSRNGNHGEHPPAGRMNAGEKIWFWLVVVFGVLVCLTGFVLVAPIYGLEIPLLEGLRPEMRGASILHAVLGIAWTAIALGHIYIGTAGTEGAFEGMSTGYVSEEWARQHHDRWHAEMVEKGEVIPAGSEDPERAARQADGQSAIGGPAAAG